MNHGFRFFLLVLFVSFLAACSSSSPDPTPLPEPEEALTEMTEGENAQGDIELSVTLKFRAGQTSMPTQANECPCLQVQTVDLLTPKGKTIKAVVKVAPDMDTSQELRGNLRVRKIPGLNTLMLAGIFRPDSAAGIMPIVLAKDPQKSNLGNFEIQDFKSRAQLIVTDTEVAGLILNNGQLWSSLVGFPESSLKALLGAGYGDEVSLDIKAVAIETELGFLLEISGLMRLKLQEETLSIAIDGFAFQPLEAKPQGLSVPLEQVPLPIRRQAMWQLEEVRGTDMAPGWENASLAKTVSLFYRPDIESVAYYEFAIAGSEHGGFMMVSAGQHDYPVPHWDFKGKPISEELKAKATASPAKFFKLDALSYAAEDAAGEKVAQLGNALFKLSGLDPKTLDETPELGRAYTRSGTNLGDSEAASFEHELIREGKQSSDIRLEPWASWAQLKQEYAESYAVLIAALKREAATDWQILAEEAEYGEGLFVAEERSIGLLSALNDFRLRGPGAEFVRLRRSESLPNSLELQVGAVKEKLQFELDLAYQNGQNETLKFFITPTTLGEPAELQTQGSWSAWTRYWATGKHDDQPLYFQYTFGSCAIGCGPVAWSMLFAWGDYQAENGNSYWSARCGLFDGCGNEPPLTTQTSDVTDMIEDIHVYVDTFCITGSGATYPWDMPDADQWFNGRTGTNLDAHWNSAGFAETRLREYARDSIRDRDTPAIIGTGWLSHYPMAYGYRYRSKSSWFGLGTTYEREFYVNQGWGGVDNGWVSASTWFSGEIEP